MQTRARVLLADDHKPMLERVKSLLEPEVDVVGAVLDGQALVRAAAELKPDILVVDISMPALNGIDAVKEIMKSGAKPKTVFLTVHEDPEMLPLCFHAGGLAFVVKSRLASDLIPAIRCAMSNRTFVSPTLPWEIRV